MAVNSTFIPMVMSLTSQMRGGGGRFVLMDANQIIPEKDIFTAHGGSYAIFSDWFRWSLLYEKGNFWVDMDVICLKPFVFNEDLVYGFEDNTICM